MNLRTTYIDNCKLKKTRNRLMGCSIEKGLLYINIGNNCCTQYFYYSMYCVDT